MSTEPKPESPAELAAEAKRLSYALTSAQAAATYHCTRGDSHLMTSVSYVELHAAIDRLAALATLQASASANQEPAAKVLFRQDEDGLEPVMFYGPGTEPDPAQLKERFVLRDVWLSPTQALAATQARPASGEALTDGGVLALNPHAQDRSKRPVWADGFRFAEKWYGIAAPTSTPSAAKKD